MPIAACSRSYRRVQCHAYVPFFSAVRQRMFTATFLDFWHGAERRALIPQFSLRRRNREPDSRHAAETTFGRSLRAAEPQEKAGRRTQNSTPPLRRGNEKDVSKSSPLMQLSLSGLVHTEVTKTDRI